MPKVWTTNGAALLGRRLGLGNETNSPLLVLYGLLLHCDKYVGQSAVAPGSPGYMLPGAVPREKESPSGQVVGSLAFPTVVGAICDMQLLAGPQFPEVIGFQHETIRHTFVSPAVLP
jgi:hypothetical protein